MFALLAGRSHIYSRAQFSNFSRSFSTTQPLQVKVRHVGTGYEFEDLQAWNELKTMDYHQATGLFDATAPAIKPKRSKVPLPSARKRYFKDKVKVHVVAGRGGSGIVAFERAPNKRVGPPTGGTGGDGGHVIIRAVDMEPNLSHLKYYHGAENGKSGSKESRRGRRGEPLYLDVPLGTVITQFIPQAKPDIDDDDDEFEGDPEDQNFEEVDSEDELVAHLEREKAKDLAADDDDGREREVKGVEKRGVVSIDLSRAGEFFIAARGGKGGSGNERFVHGGNRSPQESLDGSPGEDRYFELELKMIAQFGLVGFPNAGKSSFLAAISNATPKIANYPFTTLSPSIGTLQWIDTFSLTMADLPGLIKDAHLNRGLGHEFLKHIERTHVILFVLDMSSDEAWNQFTILIDELKQYRNELIERSAVIIANKMDVKESTKNLGKFKKKLEKSEFGDLPVFPVSASEKMGIDVVKEYLRNYVEDLGTGEGYRGNPKDIVPLDISSQFKILEEDE